MSVQKPAWVEALGELEDYAREQGWRWADTGHAGLIRRLIEQHRAAVLWGAPAHVQHQARGIVTDRACYVCNPITAADYGE